MVTLLLILMMVCNLWILFYLTWEHKDARKADNRKEAWTALQSPPDDMMGKSRFSMPETKPQATAPMPNAATEKQSEAVDEKDVTFAGEIMPATRQGCRKWWKPILQASSPQRRKQE